MPCSPQRRTIPFLCLAAVFLAPLVLDAAAPAKAPQSPASPAALKALPSPSDLLDQKVLATAHEGSQIMSNLTYLSDMIGARLTGSAALKRANEWAAEKMKSYGLSNVHLEPWTIPVGWQRGTATAHVIDPDNGCQLSIASLAWAPGTKGTVEGDVVILKATKVEELAAYKGRLKNAIVLRGAPAPVAPITQLADARRQRPVRPDAAPGPNGDARGPGAAPGRNGDARGPGAAPGRPGDPRRFRAMVAFRRQLNKFLRDEGVAALFVDSGKPHMLLNMTGSWRGPDPAGAAEPLTTLFVAHEHYAMLYRLASRPTPARTRVALNVENTFITGPITVYNTVGEIRGSEKPDEVVVIGGHLDSWDLGQGTTDNGTGSCIALEAARVLAKCPTRPKRTIRCILFTGEEQGLRGSHAYVDQHKSELSHISMAIIHDMGTGRVTGLGLMGHQNMQKILEPELANLKPLGVTRFGMGRMGGSDHASFDQAGVPGFYFLQDPDEYRFTHHSQSDTLDKAHEADLIQGVQAMAVLAMRVANLPALLPHHPVAGDRQASRQVPETNVR
jgi:hypothetical protein